MLVEKIELHKWISVILQSKTIKKAEICMLVLMKLKIDLNEQDHNGDTALHIILNSNEIYKKHYEEFIENRNDKDEHTFNELVLSRFKKMELDLKNYIIDWLLKNCIDVNIKNNQGNTALHFVFLKFFNLLINEECSRFSTSTLIEEAKEMTKKLIDAGADLNIKNNDGNTCLHLILENFKFFKEKNACIVYKNGYGSIDQVDLDFYIDGWVNYPIFKILIDAGADLNIKNNKGVSAIAIIKNSIIN